MSEKTYKNSLFNTSKYEKFLNHTNVGLIILKNNLNIHFMNIHALKIYNYTEHQVQNFNFYNLFNSNQKNYINKLFKKLNKEKNNSIKDELAGINKNKNTIYINIAITKYSKSNEYIYIVVLRDITKEKINEENLKNKAFYDQLTKIPNRMLFYDRAEYALNQAIRSKDSIALIFIDLDDFKDVNDKYGHDIGDILLKNVSARLIKSARKSDTVSRIGGDEFTILMPRLNNIKDAANLAERILNDNKNSISIEGNILYPRTSIGISIYPNDGNTIKILLKNADIAMYQAKKLGKNCYKFFSNL